MPSRPRIRHHALHALALAAGLLVAGASLAATGYVLYLKDGGRIDAKEKPVAKGKNFIFQSPLGAPQSLPITDVDQEKTEKMNKEGLGLAYVLGETPDGKAPPPPGKKASLSEYIKVHKKSEIDGTSETKPEDGTTAAAVPSTAPAPSGKTGRKGEEAAALDPLLNDTFARALEGAGIRGAHLSPMNGGVKITALTDSEPQVFSALSAVAHGLKESRAMGRSVDKVDIALRTSGGEDAGHFLMSPEDAESIVNGKVSSAKYFVANVIF